MGTIRSSGSAIKGTSRLLASFSRTLRARVEEVEAHPDEPAVIIVAWAHLRTLVECNLKLFLTVFLIDYLKDPHAPLRKKGNPIPPQALKLELIRQFLVKRKLLIDHQNFIQEVQARGNAIHAFADKPIGTAEEYLKQIPRYARFLADIDSRLPNPYWPDF